MDELNVKVPESDLNSEQFLNSEQREAYDIILQHVIDGCPKTFFIDGPGGTGKTYLYCALLASVRSSGKIALATATSGVAASIMPGGRTAHSRFKIPIDSNSSSICNIKK